MEGWIYAIFKGVFTPAAIIGALVYMVLRATFT